MSGSSAATSAATTGAVVAAAIANAIKASGAIVKLDANDFETIVNRSREPLVVIAEGGLFSKHYQYLTSYKGLFFFCKAAAPIQLPSGAEIIRSKNIWIPA